MSAGEITPQSLQFANAINEVANRDKITSSDTPRTDAGLLTETSPRESWFHVVKTSRQLERENASLREQLAERDAEIAALKGSEYRAGMRAAAEIAAKTRDWAIGSDDYNNGCTHCEAAILAEADK